MKWSKIIFGLSKVFHKPCNSLRIISSVSMKYCSLGKGKTLLINIISIHVLSMNNTRYWNIYAAKIMKGAPLYNCFGFVDFVDETIAPNYL